MITARELAKCLGGRHIFRRLTFEWPAGSMLCVCGPNGTGKTTLLSMIAGLMPPDAGNILVGGLDVAREPQRAGARVAYVPDHCPVFPFLRGREWLAFVKSLSPCDPDEEAPLLEAFSLRPYLDTRFDAMSLGTAKKFLLVSALIRDVPVLVLDEPINGLDAASFEALRGRLASWTTRGLVVLTCHDPAQRGQLGAQAIELASLEGRDVEGR